MTYRERRLAKAERLRQWADKREREATAALNTNPELRRDWAFITQPGHIPERARMNARDDRAHESLAKASKMEARAEGIEAQVDRAIYSDDPDAIEALEAKLVELEARRERKKRINAMYRFLTSKVSKPVHERQKAIEKLAAEGIDFERLRAKLESPETLSWCRQPFPAYELQNLSGNITTTRKRILEVKARQQRAAEVADAGGLLITHHAGGATVSIQFEEKPEREILEALRGAGYLWQGGAWHGPADKLPPVVAALAVQS